MLVFVKLFPGLSLDMTQHRLVACSRPTMLLLFLQWEFPLLPNPIAASECRRGHRTDRLLSVMGILRTARSMARVYMARNTIQASGKVTRYLSMVVASRPTTPVWKVGSPRVVAASIIDFA